MSEVMHTLFDKTLREHDDCVESALRNVFCYVSPEWVQDKTLVPAHHFSAFRNGKNIRLIYLKMLLKYCGYEIKLKKLENNYVG